MSSGSTLLYMGAWRVHIKAIVYSSFWQHLALAQWQLAVHGVKHAVLKRGVQSCMMCAPCLYGTVYLTITFSDVLVRHIHAHFIQPSVHLRGMQPTVQLRESRGAWPLPWLQA